MEEKTNVHFEFELVESSSYAERRAVKLNSGDYPDVIKDGLTVTEIVRYGKDRLIIPLEDMQEKYCPQLMAAYDSDYGKPGGYEGYLPPCRTATYTPLFPAAWPPSSA